MKKNKANKPSWRLVNVQFVKADRSAISSIDENDVDPAHLMAAFALAGYKTSVSFNSESDCYILALTGSESTVQDFNKTFTLFNSHIQRLFIGMEYLRRKMDDGTSLSYLFDVKHDTDW